MRGEATGAAAGNSSRELLPIIYTELRRIAAEKLRHERRGITLTPTALVHEAYLRLVKKKAFPAEVAGSEPPPPVQVSGRSWLNEGEFLAAAARAMRHILVERARRQGTLKRGGTARRVRMPESRIITPTTDVDILVLDEALQEFAKHHSEKAELVNLHHFAGLSIPDAAVALRVSRATAERWWAFARAWLYDRLKDSTLLDGP